MKISNYGNRYYRCIYVKVLGYYFDIEIFKDSFRRAIHDCYVLIDERKLNEAEQLLEELRSYTNICPELTRLEGMIRREHFKRQKKFEAAIQEIREQYKNTLDELSNY